LKEFADAIRHDISAVSYILKVVNSPYYGLAQVVKDLDHAAALLGREIIRTLVISHAISANLHFDLSPYRLEVDKYFKSTHVRNALISKWIPHVDSDLLMDLSLGSNLMDIGKVFISKYVIENKNSSFSVSALDDAKVIQEAEIKAVGFASSEISASILSRWGFESRIVESIRYSNSPLDCASNDIVVKLAKLLKVTKEAVDAEGNITDESLTKARLLLEQYGIEAKPFNTAIKKIIDAI
jgi:HD-like signal output (HDOD) protein